MFTGKAISDLELRKQELLAESDSNRRALIHQWQEAQSATQWISSGWQIWRGVRPALIYLAPVVGFFLARRRTAPRGVWSKVAFVWRWLPRTWRVWQIIKAYL